jgi:L-ascorbate metabolism protein UlaG (beta-lactamase superfamily)
MRLHPDGTAELELLNPEDLAATDRLERMRAAPNYKGGRFQNPVATRMGRPGSMLGVAWEYVAEGQQRLPPGPLPVVRPEPRTEAAELGATWLGHSTVLLEIDGRYVLTDPVFGPRASPVGWAGPKRFHPPPLPLDALPRLDAVVLSHDHHDHLDPVAVRALAQRPVTFVTSLGVGAHLERLGVPRERIIELGWWQSAQVANGELTITAAPARHFSGRGLADRNRTLWSSWSIAGATRRVFFSGDTGLWDGLGDIGARLGPFDLSLVEIGAYHEAWGDVHLGPDNALAAHAMVGGGLLLPVHWGTFSLALHAWDQPIERLTELAPGLGVTVATPRPGERVAPGSIPDVAWWRRV